MAIENFDNTTIDVQTLKPFKKFIMSIGELPTNYIDSLSYAELLTWFCDYLQNKVIPVVDTNAAALKELQDYFNNLDVQDEIDNKLDEMAEDGTLEEIMASYLNTKAVFCFDNVASMKEATNLIDGSYTKTLGYYSVNDGGGSTYKIRTITNDDVVDESFIIALSDNTLIAELIIENNSVNIKQLGATITNDIEPYISKYLLHTNNKLKLYIPSGSWLCSEVDIDTWFYIYGDSSFTGNTIINSIDEQEYIFKLYNSESAIYHWYLKGIQFQSASHYISQACLIINHYNYGNIDNVSFQNVRGQCILFINCWEINFNNLIARHIILSENNINSGVFNFNASNLGSISTLYFNYIQLEQIVGNVFFVNNNCGVYNNHIGTINFENQQAASSYTDTMVSGLTYDNITNVTNLTDHYALFKMNNNSALSGITINTIDANNLAKVVYKYNNTEYVFDSIIYKGGDIGTNKTLNMIIDSIDFIGMDTDVQLLNVRNGQYNIVNRNNALIINNIMYSNTSKQAYFNVKSENNIICNSGILNFINNDVIRVSNIDFFADCASTINNNNHGTLLYDNDSYNKNKLVFNSSNATSGNGFVELISMSNTLRIRYKNTGTATNINIADVDSGNSKNYPIAGQSNGYVWLNIDLTQITNYAIGHKLKVGATAGYVVSFDCYKFI